jgi:hypothetical protein
LANGVKYSTIANGSGPSVVPGQTASVLYTGYLASNGQIFDASLFHGTAPFNNPGGSILDAHFQQILIDRPTDLLIAGAVYPLVAKITIRISLALRASFSSRSSRSSSATGILYSTCIAITVEKSIA